MMDVAREEIRGEKPKTLKTPSQIKKTTEKWAAAKRKQREKQTDEMKKENKIKALIRQMRNLDADDLKRVVDSTVTQKNPQENTYWTECLCVAKTTRKSWNLCHSDIRIKANS